MEKIIKRSKKKCVVLVLIAICIFLLGMVFISKANEDKKVAQENVGIHISENKYSNKLVYTNIISEPVSFAKSQNEEQLAFVLDGERIYVVQFTKDEIADVYNYFETNEGEYNIKGNSVMFTDDIKSLIIQSYNELTNSNDLNNDNFESVFGNYYIDANSWTSDAEGYEVVAILLFAMAALLVFATLKRFKSINETLNSEDYMKACNEEVVADYKNVIFTKNYMVVSGVAFSIINYSSIAWAYHYIFRYNFIPNHSLIYYLEGNKKRQAVNFGFSGKKVDEIVEYIGTKNNKTLLGYSSDNAKAFKNACK